MKHEQCPDYRDGAAGMAADDATSAHEDHYVVAQESPEVRRRERDQGTGPWSLPLARAVAGAQANDPREQ